MCLLPAAMLPLGTQPGFHGSRDTAPNLSGVQLPQSLTSKFSKHGPVVLARVLIKTFQSKSGVFISSEDLQHNADKQRTTLEWTNQSGICTAHRSKP